MRATMVLRVAGWRRGWDSNPRTPVEMLLEFQSSAFDRSATSPINKLRKLRRNSLKTDGRATQGAPNDKACRCEPHPPNSARSGLRHGARLGYLEGRWLIQARVLRTPRGRRGLIEHR
jgi:hypothetical protein